MKVSVITACYNSAATILDTLRSVASQRDVQCEHIVVDGASKDATPVLVRQHGSHVALLVSEPDAGIYDAMNKGLALASGEWVGFLNADDVFADERSLARIALAAASGAGPHRVDAVYGDLVYVSAADPEQVVRRWRSGAYAPDRLRFGWMPPHPTFYVRTAKLRRLGGFDTRFRIAADYDCMLRYLRCPAARVIYVEEVLVRMRTGGASNGSLRAVLRKSAEDLQAIRRNQVGGLLTLGCKNLRKLPQLWR
jgi:glycosyltransferase